MITRFYRYSIFKNLRFADPFLILYFLDLQFSLSVIGVLLGWQHLVTVIFEVPSGVLADVWGRCRATALCFVGYVFAFTGLGITWLITSISIPLWLGSCLTLFAVGEALRTGSHKAIMLDYLDSTDQSSSATDLIGRTRSISKISSRERVWRKPGFLALFFQSIVFESQIKITLKYFTQPFLKIGLGMLGMPIIAPAGVSGIMSAGVRGIIE